MFKFRSVGVAAGLAACLSVHAVAQPVPGEATAAAAVVSLSVPAMAGPLSFSATPMPVAANPLGTLYIDGVVSGLGMLQTHPAEADRYALADVGNAQVFVQKIDGVLQFYLQAGLYGVPVIGQRYTHLTDASDSWNTLFGAVPQAFIKIAPTDKVSIQLGKLPTLIGGEYTFTFENVNIERGLLWNQEPAVSRGVQVNLISGPLAFAVSVNDGCYSGRYNWLSGSAAWTIDPANLLIIAAGANLGKTATNSFATPRAQNNSSIYNVIYTYTHTRLMITPYVQYTAVSPMPSIGISRGASTWSGALLGTYGFAKSFVLGARGEYIASRNSGAGAGSTDLLYGPGSAAASFTVTPTVILDHWFARADLSLVKLTHAGPGDAFGRDGNAHLQARAMLEAGSIF